MSQRIVIRVDADSVIGGGHAMRCLTLADALAGTGAQVTFVSAAMPEPLAERIARAGHQVARIERSPGMIREGGRWEEPTLSMQGQLADGEATRAAAGKADWTIVDHYLLDAHWHSAARSFADRLLVIDDLANRRYDCDILLDQTLRRSGGDYRARIPAAAKVLTGAAYALLRPEFARARRAALDRRKSAGAVQRILISMGTADANGVTAPIVDQVVAAAPEAMIDVVLGPQAPSLEPVRNIANSHPRICLHSESQRMAELMRDADLAVGAAGMTSWERCCLGLPAIMLVLADNQRAGADALRAAGVAVVADDADQVGDQVRGLIQDHDRLARMSAAAFAIVDGLGTGRVLATMLGKEGSGELNLRPATLADGEWLWLWRNDPVTRAQSRSREPILWEEHVKWLGAALGRRGSAVFLAERNGQPVGTVRFDPLPAGGREVSIAVAAEARGGGQGAAMLRAGCDRVGPGAIFASVREDNGPSQRLFEACGFVAIESAEAGYLRYQLGMDAASPGNVP